MKRCALMVGVLVVMVGCKSKPAVHSSDAVPQPVSSSAVPSKSSTASPSTQAPSTQASTTSAKSGPKFDWQQYDDENFETKPSQGRVFSIPGNATRLQVKLTASSAVDAAAMTRAVFKSRKGVVREDRLFRLPCAVIGVHQDEARCSLDPKEPSVYVVRDARVEAGDPVALALLKKQKGHAPAADAPVDKIHVTLSVWACVADCGPLGGPAR